MDAKESELLLDMNEAIAFNDTLDGVDMKVFLYLTRRLNFRKPTLIRQIEIALDLKRNKTHISRSIKKLSEAGLLVPGPNGSRYSEWMLNPDFGK